MAKGLFSVSAGALRSGYHELPGASQCLRPEVGIHELLYYIEFIEGLNTVS